MTASRSIAVVGPRTPAAQFTDINDEIGALYNGVSFWVNSVAGTNTLTGSVTPALDAYKLGEGFWVQFVNTNTSETVTLNIDSRGAKSIRDANGDPPEIGALAAGTLQHLVYDGTYLRIVGPAGSTDAIGIPGISPGRQFAFDASSTVAGVSAPGEVRGNHATFASITEFYFSETDRFGLDATAWLGNLDDFGSALFRTLLYMTERGNEAVQHEFIVTGSVTDNGSYRTVSVTHRSGSAAPGDGDFLVAFAPTRGLDGTTGLQIAANQTALAGIDHDTVPAALLNEADLEGIFVFDGSDLSAEVADNTSGGLYLPPTGEDGSSGAWKRLEKVLRPDRDFGMKFDGTLNQEQAFVDLAKELRRRGGGRVEFPDGKDVHVLDDGAFAANFKLLDLGVGMRNARLHFNGCKIINNYNFATEKIAFLVHAEDIGGLTIDGLETDQPNYHANNTAGAGNNFGFVGAWIQGDSRDIDIVAKMRGGVAALWVASATGSGVDFPNGTSRTRGIRARVDCEGMKYAVALSAAGDDSELHCKAKNVERALIAYDVQDLTAKVEVRLGPYGSIIGNQILIEPHSFAGLDKEFRSLRNVDIHVRAIDDDPAVAATWIGSGNAGAPEHFGANVFMFNAAGPLDTFSSGLKFRVDVENNGSWSVPILTARTGAGVHTVSDIEFSGHFTNNAASAQGDIAYYIFHNASGSSNWSSDHVSNVTIRDIVIDGDYGDRADMYVDAAYIRNSLIFENIESAGGRTLANTGAHVSERGVNFT